MIDVEPYITYAEILQRVQAIVGSASATKASITGNSCDDDGAFRIQGNFPKSISLKLLRSVQVRAYQVGVSRTMIVGRVRIGDGDLWKA